MSFLEKIRPLKEAEVAALRTLHAATPPVRCAPVEIRDFGAALRGGQAIIAEVKHRSPSHPQFRQDAAPAVLARSYERCGAAALSVVTDQANFGTSLDDVPAMRRASRLPVLVKDFVVAPEQVRAAWAVGADAILLIARMLSGDELRDLYGLVRELGLEALVECHDGDDLDKALDAGARIVGINNRNLATLTTDLEQTPHLLRALPGDVISVCESGITLRAEVERFTALGAEAFLVGHALLMSPDPGRKVRQLLGRESETGPRLKVCGLTKVGDARRAWDLGADLLGVIFAPSPRQVTVETVQEIRRELPQARLCGVFANETPEAVAQVAVACDLDLIQLHGAETPEICARTHALTGLPIIRALTADRITPRTVADHPGVAAFLVDLPKDGSPVGEAADGDLLIAAEILLADGAEVLLAGGLRPDNLAHVRRLGPLGLDVCRGVEAEPGIKDPHLLASFIAEARS